MEEIHIYGGVPLRGQVKIQGSKNAVLPILAATVLVKGTCELHNCPKISDVTHMQTLLTSLGGVLRWEENTLKVDCTTINSSAMPSEAVTGMRSSLTLLGALLARCGQVFLEQPGGCTIGKRPIDLHLMGLTAMGCTFATGGPMLYGTTKGLSGAEIFLPCASVGATENLILAGVLAKGETKIHGAAKEPEVEALCNFLIACGAKISNNTSGEILIQGVEALHPVEFTIPSDRIVAGTYLFAGIATGGEIFLEDAPLEQMDAVLLTAEKMGAHLQKSKQGLYVKARKVPCPIPDLETEVYPGFPTDLQSPLLAVLGLASGESHVRERIFENRFHVVPQLQKMGAQIEVTGNQVSILGPASYRGTALEAQELRGGGALVIAALAAKGESIINKVSYIYRGYENICRDFKELGARIYSV